MDIRQLRYFLAIVEKGSFSRASAFLNVAQPALSQHVRNMEAAVGQQLLMRGTKGVAPTQAGEILTRHARLILNQLSTAEREIRSSDVAPIGEVRVGLPGTISEILAIPLLTEVRSRFPGIRLRIAEAMSGFVLEWIRRDRVDLGIVYKEIGDGGISTFQLFDEELVFFGRSGGEDVDQPADTSITFAQIARYPLIVPGQAHGLRERLDAAAAEAGVDINLSMEVDAYSNIKALVAGGFGYSILPLNAIKREIALGGLRYWRIDGPTHHRSVYLAFPVNRSMSTAAGAVVGVISDVLQSLFSRGDWVGVDRLNPDMTQGPAFGVPPQ